MTNENTVTLFPCRDAVTDGCPNDTSAPDTYCADCHLFHEEMAATKALLADESWKPNEDTNMVIGFEVVEFKGDVDNLPVIVHTEKESDLVIVEDSKPDLDSACYTMNAAEVDAQAALYEIAAVLAKYQDTLKQLNGALASYEVN